MIVRARRILQRVLFRHVLVALCLAAAVLPLAADPVPSLDQLTVIDQGRQITILWHFYYKLLPKKVSLPTTRGQVALDDPATLKSNLTALAAGAFEVTLDGKAQEPLSLDVNLAADGGCFATLVYPGRKNARLQLRETILPLYPPSYVIDYEIYSPLARARGVTGYFTGGANPPVAEYTQIGDDYQPSVFDALSAPPAKLFKAELRAAWLNPGWLFLTIIVVLMRPARELYPLAWIMAVAWILPIVIWAKAGAQVSFALHPFVPALVTAAIAALLVRGTPPRAIVLASLAAAGLLNGCLEIQQTTLERPPPTGANLTGLCLGLVAGFALVFAVGIPIIAECRKFPGFQRTWAPTISLALAVAALVLAWTR